MRSDQPELGWRPPTADIVIGGIAAVFCISGAALDGVMAGEPNITVLGVLVLLAQCVPLFWRARHPVVVCATAGAAAAIYGAADWPDPLLPLGFFIALATVVELCRRRTAIIVWLLAAVSMIITLASIKDSDAVDVWVGVVVLTFAPLLGEWQRSRRAYLAELAANAERLGREHERDIERAQLAERAHLARELHDIVAHHVSMMVVQAEAGASTVPRGADPMVTTSFDGIARTGRETLAELRTLLDVLRTDGTRPLTTPQPGIDQIDELIDQVRATGLDIDLAIEGDRRAVPTAVGLSAYRVVQEGLTNVIKHAHASKVSVSVRYRTTSLELDVSDDGGAAPGATKTTAAINATKSTDARSSLVASTPGHGLVGLRERVALLDGTLTTRRRPNGGFELNVSLPVRD